MNATYEFDLLAVGAHPDDTELFAGGTLALAAQHGWRVAIADLTRGEAATLGTPELRAREAAEAAKLLGVTHREQVGLGDGLLANVTEQRVKVVEMLRRLRPRIVLTHGYVDRHPDHIAAHALVRDAVFLAHVGSYGASEGPAQGERVKVQALAYFYGNTFQPDPPADWVIDISSVVPKKYAALEAYSSQFRIAATQDAAATYIGSHEFWDHIDRRSRIWGHMIGVTHGEPFKLLTPAHAAHPLVQLG